MKVGLAGRFKIEATNAAGVKRTVVDWFDNLLTDKGLDMCAQNSIGTNLGYCRLGSGNTPPTVLDVGLESQVGFVSASSATTGATTVSPYYKWVRNVYRFGPGVADGNLSEIGIGPTSTGQLFSRALIKDALGSPTTITILPDETLDVSYEFRVYVTEADWTGDIVIGGVTHAATIRAANAGDALNVGQSFTFSNTNFISAGNAYNLGPITGTISPGGGSSPSTGPGSHTHESYIPGSYYRDTTVTAELTDLNQPVNAGGAGLKVAQSIAVPFDWQIKWVPPIPKDGTKVLTLTFRLHWARYTIP